MKLTRHESDGKEEAAAEKPKTGEDGKEEAAAEKPKTGEELL